MSQCGKLRGGPFDDGSYHLSKGFQRLAWFIYHRSNYDVLVKLEYFEKFSHDTVKSEPDQGQECSVFKMTHYLFLHTSLWGCLVSRMFVEQPNEF